MRSILSCLLACSLALVQAAPARAQDDSPADRAVRRGERRAQREREDPRASSDHATGRTLCFVAPVLLLLAGLVPGAIALSLVRVGGSDDRPGERIAGIVSASVFGAGGLVMLVVGAVMLGSSEHPRRGRGRSHAQLVLGPGDVGLGLGVAF